jgi:copper chaperone CopZ
MKTLTFTVVMLFGAFFLAGCSETKDTSESEVEKTDTPTEQKESTPGEELTMKEKAGEEVTKNDEGKTKQLKVKDSKLESASFTVPTIHCSGCEKTISGSVKQLDGVQDVKADFDTKIVQVTYAGDKVIKEEIAIAIDASGFKCEINN